MGGHAYHELLGEQEEGREDLGVSVAVIRLGALAGADRGDLGGDGAGADGGDSEGVVLALNLDLLGEVDHSLVVVSPGEGQSEGASAALGGGGILGQGARCRDGDQGQHAGCDEQ